MRRFAWETFRREDYLRMLDRQWPFWSAVTEFVLKNGISSVVEVGCGIGHLCHSVDSYVGIDLNQTVLDGNELFYRRGTWLCRDWLEGDGLMLADLFLSAATLEHSETPERFLETMFRWQWRYAVVTFPERMRAAIKKWAVREIYDLPLSRRPRQARQVSVLVIDRTGVAEMEMWSRRALNAS